MVSIIFSESKIKMKIKEYLEDLLNNQLKEIKYRYRVQIVDDIKNRMCSLLSKWDDVEYRTTILFVTKEEALFYEPDAPDEVKEFVVATVRNSMLEVAASNNCSLFKMQEPLSNKKIKEVTSGAITYFKQCEFRTLQEEIRDMEFKDVFEEAIIKYPLAWEILKKTALTEEKILEFEEIHKMSFHDNDINLEREVSAFKTVVCDGYSLEFDDYLKEKLEELASGVTDVFYVDSFKMLSRNFEKVLHVSQIIFECGGSLVTCNYFIRDGYIEKRRRILRAAHGEQDVVKNVMNMGGTSPRLRDVLKGMGTNGGL